VHVLTADEIAAVEDEEFEPPRHIKDAMQDTAHASTPLE